MLPCIWCKKKRGTRGDSRCVTVLSTFWRLLWSITEQDARQHGIYLFYIITKQSTTGLCPLWRTRKKPFDVIYYLHKMKQSHWLLRVAKNCDWFRKITPLLNLTRGRFSWNENLQRKQNWTAKCTNLKEMLEKSSLLLSFIIRAARWAEKLGCSLEYSRSWKKYARKLATLVNLEAIRFDFWAKRSVSDGGNLCPLWSVIVKSVWNSVEDTF